MKEVIIRTIIFIDGEAQDKKLYSADCSESIAEFGDDLSDSEIVDIIFNDEELNPHYSY